MTRMWAERGHDVTVIAGQVHYATGEKPPEYEGKLVHEEWHGDVRVLRAYTPSSFHDSIPGRMWAFGGFTFGAIAVLLKEVRQADVVIATSPSLLVLIPGLVARWMRRWPLIFEVRDLWPESAVTTGVLDEESLITRVLYGLEALGYRSADRINVLTPAFREDIIERGLASDDELVFIPNGADLELFEPGPIDQDVRREMGWGDKFVVVYAGAHGIANHLIQYVETAERLKDREDILLVSVGDGPQKEMLVEETRKRGLSNLQWLDTVPKTRMAALLRAADAGTAMLQRIETFKTVYPNKIFDYMSAGRPTLCAIDGVARELVEDADAGVFVEPERPDDFAEKIIEMAEMSRDERQAMGESGRRYVEENFSRTALADRYLQVMEQVVS